jgi:hypothetical protein
MTDLVKEKEDPKDRKKRKALSPHAAKDDGDSEDDALRQEKKSRRAADREEKVPAIAVMDDDIDPREGEKEDELETRAAAAKSSAAVAPAPMTDVTIHVNMDHLHDMQMQHPWETELAGEETKGKKKESKAAKAPSSSPSTSVALPSEVAGFQRVQLDDLQKVAVAWAMTGRNLCVMGQSGTGCTYVARVITTVLTALHYNVQCLSPLEITAQLLHNGITIHRHIGRDMGKNSKKRGKTSSSSSWDSTSAAVSDEESARWLHCSTLVVDDAFRADADLFEQLDQTARHARQRPDEPFGGMQIIVLGEHLGPGPVPQSEKFIFDTDAWKEADFTCVELLCNHRYTDRWFRCLKQIRRGLAAVDDSTQRLLESRVRAEVPNDGFWATVITCKTETAKQRNKELAGLLKCQKPVEFDSSLYQERPTHQPPTEEKKKTGKGESDTKPKTLKDQQNMLHKRFAGHSKKITLHKGAQVLLTTNYGDLPMGYRGVVVDFHPSSGCPQVRFADNKTHEIKKVNMRRWEKLFGWLVCVRLPLTLAFAATLYSLSGRCLQRATLALARDGSHQASPRGAGLYQPGQAYAGLARIQSEDGVFISRLEWEIIQPRRSALAFDLRCPRLQKKQLMDDEDFNRCLHQLGQMIEAGIFLPPILLSATMTVPADKGIALPQEQKQKKPNKSKKSKKKKKTKRRKDSDDDDDDSDSDSDDDSGKDEDADAPVVRMTDEDELEKRMRG